MASLIATGCAADGPHADHDLVGVEAWRRS